MNINWAKALCKELNPSATVKVNALDHSESVLVKPPISVGTKSNKPVASLKIKPKSKTWICGKCLRYFEGIKQECPRCRGAFCVESIRKQAHFDDSDIDSDDLIELLVYGGSTHQSEEVIRTLLNLYKTEKDTIPNKVYAALKGILDISQIIESDEVMTFGYKDFLIRCSNFSCMSKGHQMETIEAEIRMLPKNPSNEVYTKIVPAAYCTVCDNYYILDSVYEEMRHGGIPLCPVCDEKVYIRNRENPGGIQFADESILKQFGYTVNQAVGLSAQTRQSLLAVLIDNRVLSKNEIISYLDSFINFRKSEPKYDRAISKWEEDRTFVYQYRMGNYSKYKVSGLYR